MDCQYSDMGARIRIRRKELQIKQAELAEVLGISNNHMSSIENGKQKPSIDIFVGICNCLNVSPDYLLLGVMHPQNIPQDIADKLLLCSSSDVDLAREFIELLVRRNSSVNSQKEAAMQPDYLLVTDSQKTDVIPRIEHS